MAVMEAFLAAGARIATSEIAICTVRQSYRCVTRFRATPAHHLRVQLPTHAQRP